MDDETRSVELVGAEALQRWAAEFDQGNKPSASVRLERAAAALHLELWRNVFPELAEIEAAATAADLAELVYDSVSTPARSWSQQAFKAALAKAQETRERLELAVRAFESRYGWFQAGNTVAFLRLVADLRKRAAVKLEDE